MGNRNGGVQARSVASGGAVLEPHVKSHKDGLQAKIDIAVPWGIVRQGAWAEFLWYPEAESQHGWQEEHSSTSSGDRTTLDPWSLGRSGDCPLDRDIQVPIVNMTGRTASPSAFAGSSYKGEGWSESCNITLAGTDHLVWEHFRVTLRRFPIRIRWDFTGTV